MIMYWPKGKPKVYAFEFIKGEGDLECTKCIPARRDPICTGKRGCKHFERHNITEYTDD